MLKRLVIIVGLFCCLFIYVYCEENQQSEETIAPATIMPATMDIPTAPLISEEKIDEKQEEIATVTIPKKEYDELRKKAERIELLNKKINQLLVENESLAVEAALWKYRLTRVFQCSTIQEAVEELQSVLNQQRNPNQ